MFALAQRNQMRLSWSLCGDLRAAYSFTGLRNFLNLYVEGCRVLARQEDFYGTTLAYLNSLADRVKRAEMFIGPKVSSNAVSQLAI